MSSEERIPLSVPHLGGNEWTYVKSCLDEGWVSSVGAFVDRFERELAERVGARAAVACASGTAALHVSLLLAGVRAGDEVVVPALTFIAPANAVTYLGAHPLFVDAEPETCQLDVELLGAFLESGCERRGGALVNRATGRRISAVLPVHVLGHPCDAPRLAALAARHGLALVEDATEALGARVGGRAAGTHGLFGCFSFNGNKIITTGSGGMLVTDDLELAARARYLTTQAKDDPIEFVHGAVGFNYRLSNVAAALGVAQLEQLDAHVAAKGAIARRYDAAFAGVPGLEVPRTQPWATPNHWLYTVRIDPARFGADRRRAHVVLRDAGIETRPLWQPLHLSPAHRGAFALPCPVAERLQDQCLSLPCSVGLTEAAQERVVRALLSARHS